MTKIKKIIIAIVAILGIGTGGAYVSDLGSNRPEASYGYSSVATSGAMTLTAGTKAMVLATSSRRAYAEFNTTCGLPVYLRMNTASTSLTVTPDEQYVPATGGIMISSTTPSYEIGQENRYTGVVYASSSAACVINVTEAQF